MEHNRSTVQLQLFPRKTLWNIIAVGMCAGFLAVMLANPSPEVIRKNLIFGIVSSVLVGNILLPKGPIQGYLSFLWQGVSGISLFYLLGLVFMFFQTREGAMEIVREYIDPTLQFINYEETSYGQDCSINKNSLYHSCFDLFALAHFLGWFFKTLICRDIKLIFFASVSFEMIEYALRNVLNNFKECWWDHLIIDIFGCNLLGIICGFWVIDQLGLDRYRWSLREAPLQYSHWANLKRFFKTWHLSDLETKAFTSLKHFLKMVFFIVLFQSNDLTLFFLKYVWQIPPDHFLCIGRVWVVGLLCFNVAKEYYDFMKHGVRYFKVNLLLLLSIIGVEVALIVSHGRDEFGHAYIDGAGKILLGCLLVVFLVLLVKIGVSDVLRGVKRLNENMEENRRIVERMESAKLIRQL